MTSDELFQLGKDPPIRLLNGTLGFIAYYIRASESAGVKVPGRDQLYEIPLTRVADLGNGALVEIDGDASQ